MGIDLSGVWRAAADHEDLRRSYVELDFDDSNWAEFDVPGHWQRHPDFAPTDGPVLHRRRFEHAIPAPGRRHWLRFDGVFYQSDVWLDGALLGDSEGYFVRHQFEVTEALGHRTDHALAMAVTCAPQRQRTRKRNITGVFQHWDQFDTEWNPGGIWRGVHLDESGSVRIVHSRIMCTDAHTDLATVAIRLVLDSSEECDISIRTSVADVDRVEEHHVAVGENQVNWTIGVEQPDLWWPRSLGEQPLHDVTVDVVVSGATSDAVSRRIGFRSIETTDWITRINGQQIFLKGANQGPTDYWMAEAEPKDHRAVVELARDTGLDMIRMQAHVGHPAFYEAADELGMIIWQDFPLQWGYHRSIRRQAVRQAREMVDLLGHHPSIALWCAHNEPMAIDPTPQRLANRADRGRLVARAAVAQQLPAYNRTVIDRSVSRMIRRCDPSRPVVTHAGGLPNLAGLTGTDTHSFLGWFAGDDRQFPMLMASLPRLARFVGAFGAQAPPTGFGAGAAAAWPSLDWEELGRRQGLQKGCFDRYVPPVEFDSADEWVDAAQRHQADVVRFHVETLRRLKYRPCGGFAVLGLADSAPGVTFALVDHNGQSKLAHQALADACRPVLLIADRLPPHLHGGERLTSDVHIVNDLRHPVTLARCDAVLRWPGGEHRTAWEGTAEADSCALVGRVDVTLPHVDGSVELELSLVLDGDVVQSRYTSVIVADHGPH